MRAWPDTSATIAIFDDQLDTSSMTDAQFQFAATHYAGTQKVTRSAAEHLRSFNPDFLILHYRLAQALGRGSPGPGCTPGAADTQIIHGDRWIPEWPGDNAVQESWFFHWQGQRVFNCVYGHYLMDLDNDGWRQHWTDEIIQQLQANADDGVFADSFSVPNYFGADAWRPRLPLVDAGFESEWAAREHAFTVYVRSRLGARWKWIPNVGAWVTTRDPSDYSNVDGVMIEGFAYWGSGNYLAPDDWRLQMDRVLGMVASDKIVIDQTYPEVDDTDGRAFALGSYLLVKGSHTYLNLEVSGAPEWFPEEGLDLGAATDPLPGRIADLLDSSSGLYMRHYAHGLVLVNPGPGSRAADLAGEWRMAQPHGGGPVGADGVPDGTVAYETVSHVQLGEHQAAILLAAS